MKDARTQTADEEAAWLVSSMAPRVRRHTQIFTLEILLFYL